MYEPGVAPDVTTNEAEAIFPDGAAKVQVDELIKPDGPVDEIEHDVPVEAKAVVVVIVTVVPAPPAVGLSVMAGWAYTGTGSW
jgi:hypothetical protein